MGRNPKEIPATTDESVVHDLPKEEEKVNSTSNITMIDVSLSRPESVIKNSGDVLFRIKYSDDFKGKKTFKDGDETIMSKETAEIFTKRGMGEIVKI